jgi:hypothetical protein
MLLIKRTFQSTYTSCSFSSTSCCRWPHNIPVSTKSIRCLQCHPTPLAPNKNWESRCLFSTLTFGISSASYGRHLSFARQCRVGTFYGLLEYRNNLQLYGINVDLQLTVHTCASWFCEDGCTQVCSCDRHSETEWDSRPVRGIRRSQTQMTLHIVERHYSTTWPSNLQI